MIHINAITAIRRKPDWLKEINLIPSANQINCAIVSFYLLGTSIIGLNSENWTTLPSLITLLYSSINKKIVAEVGVTENWAWKTCIYCNRYGPKDKTPFYILFVVISASCFIFSSTASGHACAISKSNYLAVFRTTRDR